MQDRRTVTLGAAIVLGGCCFGSGSASSGPGGGGAADTPAVALTQISVASDHACAITATGTVECWGLGDHGQLGNGLTVPSPTAAVVVAGIHDAVEVDVGFQVSCARRRDGTVWCWGRGDSLGTGGPADATTPVQVPGVEHAIDLSVDLGTYVLSEGGDVAGWGTNLLGLLALPDWIEDVPTPIGVIRHEGLVEVAASGFGGCGRTSGGAVFCWGAPDARMVLPTSGVDALTANLHTCARAAGTWMCAGPNEHGELGLPIPEARVATPFPRRSVRSLVASFGATWVVQDDGSVDCVGTECEVGVARPALAGVQEISVDGDYVCARETTGVQCWGRLTQSAGEVAVYGWTGASTITLAGAEPAPARPGAAPVRPVGPAQLIAGEPGWRSLVEPAAATGPAPDEPLVMGQVIAALWHQSWYEARITEARPDGRVSIRYESGERPTLDRSHIRTGRFTLVPDGVQRYEGAPLTTVPLAPGTEVVARDGYWFPARVVSDDGGERVRIHWVGHTDQDDSSVRRTDLRAGRT